MEAIFFKHLLTNHAPITLSEANDLSNLIEKYPYLQSARALQLKGLKTNFDARYNQTLKVAAAYTTDRTVLFDYITSREFIEFIAKENQLENKTVIENTITETPPILSDEISNIEDEIIFNQTSEVLNIIDTLEIGKPLAFNVNDTFSFNEWLQLTAVKPIERSEKVIITNTQEPNSDTNLQSNLIDTFINTKPKIAPPDKNSPIVDISEKSSKQNEHLMTETLAKVYLEQKKYKNAIKAYKILSLKYPEKSGYFADQIKAITILQNNN